MQITRRAFGKATSFVLLGFTAIFSSFLAGCGFVTDIEVWIPVAIVAINGIVTVVGTLMPPGALTFITLVKASLSDLDATVTQYANDTNPADKATWEAKISTILNDIASNFQSFLTALNLGDNPIVNIVIGLANVLLAAIAGFLGQLPATSKSLSMSLRVGSKTMTVVPKFYKNVKDFKHDYNAVAIADGHPEIQIK